MKRIIIVLVAFLGITAAFSASMSLVRPMSVARGVTVLSANEAMELRGAQWCPYPGNICTLQSTGCTATSANLCPDAGSTHCEEACVSTEKSWACEWYLFGGSAGGCTNPTSVSCGIRRTGKC